MYLLLTICLLHLLSSITKPVLSRFIYLIYSLIQASSHSPDIEYHKYGLNVQLFATCFHFGLLGLKGFSCFYSPWHTGGRAVRPGGHGGRWPAVRIWRCSRARRYRGAPSRRRPRWGSTGAWASWWARWSPAIWSWTGCWRPGEEMETGNKEFLEKYRSSRPVDSDFPERLELYPDCTKALKC